MLERTQNKECYTDVGCSGISPESLGHRFAYLVKFGAIVTCIDICFEIHATSVELVLWIRGFMGPSPAKTPTSHREQFALEVIFLSRAALA